MIHMYPREDRGGGGGQDGPIGAGGPDVPAGGEAPSSAERPKLKLVPRSKPAGQAAAGAAAPAPASTKKASIFGGGKAHDEFAYEVCVCVCDAGSLVAKGGEELLTCSPHASCYCPPGEDLYSCVGAPWPVRLDWRRESCRGPHESLVSRRAVLCLFHLSTPLA